MIKSLSYYRILMPHVIYDSMANCVLEWWIGRLVKKCSGLIAAALAEKKAAFYTSLSDASWTAEDRALGWEPIRHHYSSAWNGQMRTLVRRYRHHARAAWGGGAAPMFALAMGVASRRR